MKKIKIMLTGATGFSGSYLLNELINNGYEVKACDTQNAWQNKQRFHLLETAGLRFDSSKINKISLDLLDESAMKMYFRSSEASDIDVLMHTASLYDYSASLEKLRRINVEGTRNLLKYLPENLKRMLHWSTNGIFGKPIATGKNSNIPFTEKSSSPRNHSGPGPEGTELVNAYSVSKWEQEQMVWNHSRKTGLKLTVIRPAPIYGPGSLYGHGGIMQAVGKGWLPAVPLDGKNAITSSVHVKDIAGFALFCLDHPETEGEDYNVADNSIISYYEFLHYIALLTGRKLLDIPLLPLEFLKYAGIPAAKLWTWLNENFSVPKVRVLEEQSATYISSSYWISNRKTLSTGFEFMYGDVREGLKDTIQWMRENKHI